MIVKFPTCTITCPALSWKDNKCTFIGDAPIHELGGWIVRFSPFFALIFIAIGGISNNSFIFMDDPTTTGKN